MPRETHSSHHSVHKSYECFCSVTAIPVRLTKVSDERTTWSEWTGNLEGVLFPQQRGDKGMSFSSASWSSDSRGPLAWPSSISLAVPSCGAYQLQQRASTVSPRARKCLWHWRLFVFPNRRLCNMRKIMTRNMFCIVKADADLCYLISAKIRYVNTSYYSSVRQLSACSDSNHIQRTHFPRNFF